MSRMNQLSLTSLPLRDAVKLLRKAGSRKANMELLKQDIEDGAPVNDDGTLNLIHYCAWLIRESNRNSGRENT